MTNETIVNMYPRPDPKNMERALDLARADEREKWKGHLLNSVLTDAEFEEYTGSKREEMQSVDVWVSVDEDGTTKLSESELEFFEREKWDCYRWTCEGDILQSYDIFAPENNTVENFSCDMFLEVRK